MTAGSFSPPGQWVVYILECEGGTLYTGVTNDLRHRWNEHVSGNGAKYTRSHPPKDLLGWEPHPDQSSALKAEAVIKRQKPVHKRETAHWMNVARQPKPPPKTPEQEEAELIARVKAAKMHVITGLVGPVKTAAEARKLSLDFIFLHSVYQGIAIALAKQEEEAANDKEIPT